MDDLISRSALLDYLEHMESIHDDSDWLASQYNADWIYCWLESQPAVDAVEVVRCKDCRRFKPHEERPEFGFCKLYPLGLAKHENGFCDHGERKENETD